MTCCGQPLRFDPDMRGNTCGGLALIGWMMCDACGKGYLAPKGMWKLDDGSGAPWALAASGRSVTCGAIKVRAEGKADSAEVAALMRRIVRLPELEMVGSAVLGMDPDDTIGSVKVHYADGSTRALHPLVQAREGPAMRRSNPTRSVPHPAPYGGGGVDGMRNRTDFAGSSARLKRRTSKRIATNNGNTMPDRAVEPKPPPLLILFPDENAAEFGPQPIYGQYPRGLIAKILPWLKCERREILHVCSGCLPKGEGIRVDLRVEARPDVIADGRHLPFADGSHAAVMLDPPYCKEYATSLYGIDYPLPSHLLREAARVVRPGGRIAFVHYITPRPAPGTSFVKSFGLSIGFDMPMRAVSIYERDQTGLAL